MPDTAYDALRRIDTAQELTALFRAGEWQAAARLAVRLSGGPPEAALAAAQALASNRAPSPLRGGALAGPELIGLDLDPVRAGRLMAATVAGTHGNCGYPGCPVEADYHLAYWRACSGRSLTTWTNPALLASTLGVAVGLRWGLWRSNGLWATVTSI